MGPDGAVAGPLAAGATSASRTRGRGDRVAGGVRVPGEAGSCGRCRRGALWRGHGDPALRLGAQLERARARPAAGRGVRGGGRAAAFRASTPTDDGGGGGARGDRGGAPTRTRFARCCSASGCERWLRSQGFGDEELPEELEDDEDGLSEVQAASVGGRSVLGRVRRVQRLGGKLYRLPPRCASSFGYTLHAGVAVGPRDRQGLERLARYLCRPPLAKARLSRGPEGEVVLGLKRAWSDGTTELRFTPLAFLERLVALVPPPRAHQTLYHGVLARRSAWRSRVVPKGAEARKRGPTLCATYRPASRWVPWAGPPPVFEQEVFADSHALRALLFGLPRLRRAHAPPGPGSRAAGHAARPPGPEEVPAAGPGPALDAALRRVAAPRDVARTGASEGTGTTPG